MIKNKKGTIKEGTDHICQSSRANALKPQDFELQIAGEVAHAAAVDSPERNTAGGGMDWKLLPGWLDGDEIECNA